MISLSKFAIYLLGCGALVGTVSCRDDHFNAEVPEIGVDSDNENPGGDSDASGNYDEQYRPQIHYTPARNWVNDPNGLVYADGVYHLFYQYNPRGNDWGNMSWGHATSTDLMHWTEKPVALTGDDLGDIFSGSAVVDVNNTAGFGAGAIVAVYTSSGQFQQQSIAYSTDGGETFTKYSGNPVLSNNSMPDFRDPKVFWHQESGKWVMALAKGWSYEIEFYGSTDLKSWSKLSSFSAPEYARCNKGQWECPDLICLDYNGGKKWVLIVSTNPGGPAGGSGTFYFPGEFDGTTFTADSRTDYPLWLDSGADCYAGVTWSNTPGRNLLIAWMNNWNYCGAVPCTPWRSAMTLPRELRLTDYQGKPYLCSSAVTEIDGIASEWAEFNGSAIDARDAYQLEVEVSLNEITTLTLANTSGNSMVILVNGPARRMSVMRDSRTGDTSFHPNFSLPAITSELYAEGSTAKLNIFVDRSSVEIFAGEGITAQTNLAFPSSIYNTFASDKAVNARVRSLERIRK